MLNFEECQVMCAIPRPEVASWREAYAISMVHVFVVTIVDLLSGLCLQDFNSLVRKI